MNLTKPLVLAALVAATSMSFAQNSHTTPVHKNQATAAAHAASKPAHAASKPMHAKPHRQPAVKHHAKTDKPHATTKPHHGAASAPTK